MRRKNDQTLFMHIYCQYINLFQRLGLIFKYKNRFYFHKTLLNFPTAHFSDIFGHLKMDWNFGNNHFALMESLLTLELNNPECEFPLRSLLE